MLEGVPELVVREVELQPAGDPSCNEAAQEGPIQVTEGNEEGYNMFLAQFTVASNPGELTS